jgi:hypothetical protein
VIKPLSCSFNEPLWISKKTGTSSFLAVLRMVKYWPRVRIIFYDHHFPLLKRNSPGFPIAANEKHKRTDVKESSSTESTTSHDLPIKRIMKIRAQKRKQKA